MVIEKNIGQGREAVYAYYFPSQVKEGSWPHKIGRTKNDPVTRVRRQQASMQEEPVIGTIIWTDDSLKLEALIHTVLANRKLPTFGNEWFDISPKALEIILKEGTAALPLHQQIRVHRISQGMTQMDLAKSANIRQSLVSNIESGGNCTIDSIKRVLTELKLDIVLTPNE